MTWHSSIPVRTLILGVLFASIAVVAAEASLVAEPAEAIPLHTLDVSLYPDSLDAKLTNDQLGAVTFGGNLTIEKPQGVERVTVSLSADTDKGWPVVASPSTIVFINPDTQEFTVTVIVPPDTPPSVGTVTVIAQAKSPIWSETKTAEARVNVLQFYKFAIWMDGYEGMAEAGSSANGVLVIFNNGTGEDTFLIDFEEFPEVISRHDMPESVLVPPKAEMEIEFTLWFDEEYKVPFEGSMFTLLIRVQSAGVIGKGLSYTHNTHYYILFEGLEGKLFNNWPTYIAYGVVVALGITASFTIFKRVRRNKRDLPMPDGTGE